MVHRTTQDYTGLKGTSRRGYRIYRVVTPRGIEPLFSGRKPDVLTTRRRGQIRLANIAHQKEAAKKIGRESTSNYSSADELALLRTFSNSPF